jgi:hypothetical protein
MNAFTKEKSMNFKITGLLVGLALSLGACSTITLDRSSPLDQMRDRTIFQPDPYFQPTPQSMRVEMSSHLYANLAGCTIMQRYKLVTNADFTSSLNLFKYRANLIGAERVVMVYHREHDATEVTKLRDHVRGADFVLREGTVYTDVRYLTVMVGDLYDCPCPGNVCDIRRP